MISSFLFPRLLFFRERFSIPYLWLPRLLFFRERSSTLPRTIFFSISPSSVSSGNDSLLFPLAPYFLFRERSFLSFSFWNDRLFRIFGCSVFSFLPVLPGTIFYSSENNLPFFRFFRERSFLSFSFWNDRLFRIFGCSTFPSNDIFENCLASKINPSVSFERFFQFL